MTEQRVLNKVAVLYGGMSSEREISLQSGKAVIDALQTSSLEVMPVDVDESFLQQVSTLDVDKAFIALHGGAGEDGTIQAILDFADMPYTGSGVTASAVAINKIVSKNIWRSQGMPTPDYMLLDESVTWDDVQAKLGEAVIVKPANEGSSIGMHIARNAEDYAAARADAAAYDSRVFAEQLIEGGEYTVAVLGTEPLPVIKLETENSFYDFEAKYQSDDTRYICPCGLDKADEKAMQDLALNAFQAIGCSGWGRVDIMRDEQGNNYLLEVNTVPGLTSHSLVPMAAKAAGMDFQQLILNILER